MPFVVEFSCQYSTTKEIPMDAVFLLLGLGFLALTAAIVNAVRVP